MKFEPITFAETESRFRDYRYMLVGALYGFLIGNVFVLTASMVDRLLYPDLPLGMDWSLFAMRWLWIALGLALIGATATLFSEKLPSLLVGAVVAALLALVSALLLSQATMGLKIVVLIFTLIPMAAMSLPVTLILRWLVDQHEQALGLRQYMTRIVPLILLAVVLGIGSGYFLKMSKRAVTATRFFDNLLQTAPQDTENPIRDVKGFQEHMDMSYRLFQKPSETSTEGFDVRAEYPDGYNMTCIVVVYPGQAPYLSDCSSSQN
jgi:uncharacterized membrane protein (UPF0136 family)